MRFSAQEEYGLRCLLSLARAQRAARAEAPDAPRAVTVAEVAEREGMTVQNAGKMIRLLGKAGLIESVRGCKGGYRFARDPAAVSVGEVLKALGGALYESDTCEKFTGIQDLCVHSNDCSIRSLWRGLQSILDRVLGDITIADLLDDERNLLRWIEVHVEDIGVLGPGDAAVRSDAVRSDAVRSEDRNRSDQTSL